MNIKQIITGLFTSAVFLVSAYAVVNSPNNNIDSFSATHNIVQLDVATTL